MREREGMDSLRLRRLCERIPVRQLWIETGSAEFVNIIELDVRDVILLLGIHCFLNCKTLFLFTITTIRAGRWSRIERRGETS
jgi:hypothetical protein